MVLYRLVKGTLVSSVWALLLTSNPQFQSACSIAWILGEPEIMVGTLSRKVAVSFVKFVF